MSRIELITSPTNPRIKEWRRLHARRHREATGRFLIEGERELLRALASGIKLEALLLSNNYHELIAQYEGYSSSTKLHRISEAALSKVSVRTNPAKVIGVACSPRWALPDAAPSLVLVGDRIEKPGNVGAMIRSCDAAGALFVGHHLATDLANPNVIRSSQGAVFALSQVSTAGDKLASWLANTTILRATDSAERSYWDVDMTGPTAIVIGREHDGVSSLWQGATPVAIPMTGTSDSLNASAAAAVILFEAIRQRR